MLGWFRKIVGSSSSPEGVLPGTSSCAVKPFTELVAQHFDFLSTWYAFNRVIVSPTKVRYESDRVFFEITTSPRDGCVDVHYGRFGQHAGSSPGSAESLSLSVFLGAIRTYLGNYQEESVATLSSPDYADRKLADLAAGLAEFGRGLITDEAALYERAGELRFWHVGEWTQRWGTAVVMPADEIVKQRRLVPELLSLARETE